MEVIKKKKKSSYEKPVHCKYDILKPIPHLAVGNPSMTVVAVGGDVFAGGENQADEPGEQRYPRLTIIVNHHCTVFR